MACGLGFGPSQLLSGRLRWASWQRNQSHQSVARGAEAPFQSTSRLQTWCCLTTRSSGPWGIVGRVWPRHSGGGRPLNSVVRQHHMEKRNHRGLRVAFRFFSITLRGALLNTIAGEPARQVRGTRASAFFYSASWTSKTVLPNNAFERTNCHGRFAPVAAAQLGR